MRSCEDCIHHSIVTRYDHSDHDRAYDLARCDLTGEETDDIPDPCDEWVGDVDSMQAHIDGLQDELREREDVCGTLRGLLKTERNNFKQATDARAMWQERYESAARDLLALQAKLDAYDETHMPLPLDADGLPIRLGDVLESDAFGRIEVEGFVHNAVAFWSYDPQPARLATCPCNLTRHGKPRTIEDVLQTMLEQAVGYSEAHTTVALDAIAKYADELRELIGGEW